MNEIIRHLYELKRVTELELDFINGEIIKEVKRTQGIEPSFEVLFMQGAKYAQMLEAMENISK